MNLLPLLIGIVLIGSFNKQNKKQTGFDLSQIISNPDVLSLLPDIAKFFDKNATEEDKNTALMSLLANPVVFEIMQKFSKKNQEPAPEQQEKQQQNKDENSRQKQNDGNKTQQTFSDESKEFFAPIKDVADNQISKKLYSLYDNWYIKK